MREQVRAARIEAEQKVAEAKHIAEQKRIAAEKAAWDAMTPKQREAIAIKNMWIAPCKDWSCLN